MYLGRIRYQVDARLQVEKRPFAHLMIPRFTGMRFHLDENSKSPAIAQYYDQIMLDDLRNRQIVEDVLHCAEEGRNCLLLSERTQHVKLLTELLQKAGQAKQPRIDYFSTRVVSYCQRSQIARSQSGFSDSMRKALSCLPLHFHAIWFTLRSGYRDPWAGSAPLRDRTHRTYRTGDSDPSDSGRRRSARNSPARSPCHRVRRPSDA